MKFLQGLLIFVLSVGVFADDNEFDFKAGERAFQNGDFKAAIYHWEDILSEKNLFPKQGVHTMLQLSAAYQNLGFLENSFKVLEKAKFHLDRIELLEERNEYNAKILIQLSDVYVAMRDAKVGRMSCSMQSFAIDATFIDKPLLPEKFLDEALELLEEAKELVTDDKLFLANILNRQGNVLSLQEKTEEALKIYQDALGKLSGNDNPETKLLKIKVMLNEFDIDNKKPIGDLEQLRKMIDELPNSRDKSFALISLAKLIMDFKLDEQKKEVVNLLEKFVSKPEFNINVNRGDNYAIASARFYLAQFYNDADNEQSVKDLDKAIKLIVEVISAANKLGYLELLYKSEWKLVKYLKKHKNISNNNKYLIESFYELATSHMDRMEKQYSILPKGFQIKKQKLFFEYTDVLLKRAANITENDNKQKILKKAIEVLELSKIAEVKDYLRDDCITKELENQVEHLDDNLPEDVAIFYPLLFEDRIESLVVTSDGIKQNIKKHEISLEDTEIDINNLRYTISGNPANNIYEFVKIISSFFTDTFYQFEERKIISIVPSGDMRRIPFNVLYYKDENSLIEKYALVLTPSIKLTNNDLLTNNNDLLLAGTSNFPDENPKSLCHTIDELVSSACIFKNKLEQIRTLRNSKCLCKVQIDCNCLSENRGNCDKNIIDTHAKFKQCLEDENEEIDCTSNINVLLGKDFTASKLKETISKNKHGYSSVHISTHGIFQDDSKKTLLYTSDGNNITMLKLHDILSSNKTNTSQNSNLDLLVLSACQSAKGSKNNIKRAELGFSSVAISSGSSSVLGTLWSVEEEFTKELINRFYKNYYVNKLNKAKSLQQAIIELQNIGNDTNNSKHFRQFIKNGKVSPFYWASFILIGKGF
ncbi:CHAT domain-containing protein [Candidatus Halobeggiatoa sp. HSG11]|nr:CHAT domain-containing protein [Candidatus Halobeggiatoa sp. HSG11]